MDYKLDKEKLIEMEDGEVVNTYASICDYLEEEYDTKTLIKMNITRYTDAHSSPSERKDIKEKIHKMVCDLAVKEFGSESFSETDLAKFHRKLNKLSSEMGDSLYNEIHKIINNNLVNKTKTGGDKMFKTLKEAKLFTAHLDSLANEIQGLEDISEEMRLHLAFRIDKLSDLIESSAAKKEASVQKEANGMGHGAWAYDQDEARYMGTMGGTGALKRDPDEDYMDHFAGDDHMEVLKRQEPAQIMGAGAKAKQPSDNYNEQEVANKLRNIVQKVMAKTE